MRLLSLAALAALALGSAPAFARPELAQASPAAGSVASSVRVLTLTFSGPVDKGTATVEIVMTAMPGMAHHAPMKVTGFATALTPDGRTLTATLPRALPLGSYDLKWTAVAADAQRSEGRYSFTVR